MASSSKKRTTMAKIARENKLRERRADKQARKDARKHGGADVSTDDALAQPDGDALAQPDGDGEVLEASIEQSPTLAPAPGSEG
jgi:hypothetical protein